MMRTIVYSLLLGTMLAAAGCWPEMPYKIHPDVKPLDRTPPGTFTPDPVTAERVHPGNAHEMAHALWEEVDREQATEGRK